jgi:CDP-diglyceride synthetase
LSSLVKGGGGTGGTEDMAMKSVKFASVRDRTVTATAMIVLLGFLSYYFKEDGLIVVTALLQTIMYQETTTVIGGEFTNPFLKWYWFFSALFVIDGAKILPHQTTLWQAVTYGTTVLSLLGTTVGFQLTKSQNANFREHIRQAAVSALAILLVVVPSSYWIATLEEYGMVWVFFPALYVIINDTMAYVGGQLIGKHPLLPSISPKKTWEGFLVATVSTVGFAYWMSTRNNPLISLCTNRSWDFHALYPLTKTDGLILAVVTSVVGPFGGFIASIVKRAYGQKDFGNILPGHGGLVDRLDCQIFIAPFVYFFLNLYKYGSLFGGSGAESAGIA